MKAVEFCYWLQGYFEIHGTAEVLTAEQCRMVRNHLSLVFKHEIDPSYANLDPVVAQAIHDGNPLDEETIHKLLAKIQDSYDKKAELHYPPPRPNGEIYGC